MSLLTDRIAPRIVEEDGSFRTKMLGIAAGTHDLIALGRGSNGPTKGRANLSSERFR